MVDLNTLIDPASGWVITDANGINGAQQIAATACRGGAIGECYAVRLDLVSAVPEPENPGHAGPRAGHARPVKAKAGLTPAFRKTRRGACSRFSVAFLNKSKRHNLLQMGNMI